ncbi:DUF1840 domain-containing protein [Azonexus sp.]|uniref:DUF1840 domain-containing protein n=1 Tax=Azonexus sp. TaxID=1872668 RepID=UPI0039E24DDC
MAMLVTFESSETGELFMYADVARLLFDIIGKEGSARGTFTQAQMLPAAEKLQRAVDEAKLLNTAPATQEHDADNEHKPLPVSLPQRAWPFIEMLERTARSGSEAHITWQAAADF